MWHTDSSERTCRLPACVLATLSNTASAICMLNDFAVYKVMGSCNVAFVEAKNTHLHFDAL